MIERTNIKPSACRDAAASTRNSICSHVCRAGNRDDAARGAGRVWVGRVFVWCDFCNAVDNNRNNSNTAMFTRPKCQLTTRHPDSLATAHTVLVATARTVVQAVVARMCRG
jgi:hypothetical protein